MRTFIIAFAFVALFLQSVQSGAVFSGIVMDFVPDNFNSDPVTYGGQIVDLLQQIRDKIAQSNHKNLTLAMTIPAFGYDTTDLTRANVTKTLFEWIQDYTDRVIVASPRDWAAGLRDDPFDVPTSNNRSDSSMSLAERYFALAKPNTVEIAIDTSCASPGYTSYCEEPASYIEDQLLLLEQNGSQVPAYFGKSISYYETNWSKKNYTDVAPSTDCELLRSVFVLDGNSIPIENTTFCADCRTNLLNWATSHSVSSLIVAGYPAIRSKADAGSWAMLASFLDDAAAAGLPVETYYGGGDWAGAAQSFALGVIDSTLQFLDTITNPVAAPVRVKCAAQTQTQQQTSTPSQTNPDTTSSATSDSSAPASSSVDSIDESAANTISAPFAALAALGLAIIH